MHVESKKVEMKKKRKNRHSDEGGWRIKVEDKGGG